MYVIILQQSFKLPGEIDQELLWKETRKFTLNYREMFLDSTLEVESSAIYVTTFLYSLWNNDIISKI